MLFGVLRLALTSQARLGLAQDDKSFLERGLQARSSVKPTATCLLQQRAYCRTTWSPSLRPLRSSVLAPLEIPMFTAIFFLPSLALGFGISTYDFLSLS